MSHSGPEPGIFDANRSRAILGCVIAFTITSTVSVVLRVIAKGMKQISLCSEDWFIIAAQVCQHESFGLRSALAISDLLRADRYLRHGHLFNSRYGSLFYNGIHDVNKRRGRDRRRGSSCGRSSP
jgi:hypothetical protein